MKQEHTKEQENGYERYSRIIRCIESQCNESNYVGIIGNNVRSWLERRKKHYLLPDGLHVYINDEETEIADSELYSDDGNLKFSDMSYYSQEKIKYSLKENKRLGHCRLWLWGPERVQPGICIEYDKDFVYWPEIEDSVKDRCFLPSNIDPYDGNKTRKREEEGYYKDLEADMRILLKSAISKAETKETLIAYNEALKFHNKVVKIANRDNKESTKIDGEPKSGVVEFWISRLSKMRDSIEKSGNPEKKRECQQEITQMMNKELQRRSKGNKIDDNEIEI